MNGSILDDTKKLLGVSDTDTNFDKDIIIGINTSFSTLYQLGAGDDTSKPFSISDSSSKWSDFMSEGLTENIKTYIYLNTRLLFDPPTNSFCSRLAHRTRLGVSYLPASVYTTNIECTPYRAVVISFQKAVYLSVER